MRNNNYPLWLKQHLKKGVYANKTTSGYTLYRAHSVYDPTTKRARRISDGVVGTVTEAGGFVPSKKYNFKIQPITVYTNGKELAILTLSHIELQKVSVNFRYFRSEIIVDSILHFMYNQIDETDFNHSYLSLKYPKKRFNYLKEGNDIYNEALRSARKLSSILLSSLIDEFRFIYLVSQKDSFFIAGFPSANLIYKGVDFTYDPKK